MKTQYRLIKKYPGSPEVGDIVEGYGRDGWYSKGEGHSTYDWRQVVNYPEYWEEVVEKDYQIISYWSPRIGDSKYLYYEGHEDWDNINKSQYHSIHSVKRLSDGEVFTIGNKAKTVDSNGRHTIRQFRIKQKCFGKNFSGNYTYDGIDRIWIDWEENCGGNWLESTEKVVEKDYQILKSCPIEGTIYSVERLSDGEVFTLGDKIKVYQHGSIKTIDSIDLYGNTSLMKEGIWFRYNTGSCHMTHIIKQEPQPIFLTHDGKDIFAGEQVWFVNKENLYFDFIMVSLQTTFCSEKRAYFLTRKEVEEYIRKNKVLFVADDGVDIFEEDIVYIVDSTNSIHTVKVLLSNKPTEGKRCYSTYEAAEKYAIEHSRALSIEDFWEITWMETSGFNKNAYMKNLVKQRLNLK